MAQADLIPADLRPWLRGLRISAQRARAGAGFGLHQSHSRGAGLEFAQYRAYQPGDEPRQVDWKLYARSDRFFVREAERDSCLSLWLLLDCSASMGESDPGRPVFSRLDAAKVMAAASIEVALRQGDRFGLIALTESGVELLPAAAGPRQRDRCHLLLHGLKAGGSGQPVERLRPIWERIGGDALAVLLTDGLDGAALELVEALAKAGRELKCLRLLTAAERDFQFAGGTRFVDPESGAELLTDAPAVRAQFLRDFGVQRQELRLRLAAVGVPLVEHVLDEALGPSLRALFDPRPAPGAR